MPRVSFQNSSISYKLPFKKKDLNSWINQVITSENFSLKELSYVFTSDEELNEINKTYLDHDDYTDIITFDYSEEPKVIQGEIYISIERVRENAVKYETSFKHEFARVMIHGVIHLLGFEDKTTKQKQIMRKKEDACISLLKI